MKYLLPALLLMTVIFFACSKKTTPSQTRGDILRTGKWKISAATLTVSLPNGKDTNLNYLVYLPACHLDDYINFGQMTNGSLFSNSVKCAINDPDSVGFQWTLGNNNTTLSLYRGFSLIYSVIETVLPYHFDTLQHDPYLILDTTVTVEDTTFYHYDHIALDTIWDLHFKTDSISDFDIYGGEISNFSQSSFDLTFSRPDWYPDTTHNHTGQYTTDSAGVPVTRDWDPVIRQDTFKYKFTFTNF